MQKILPLAKLPSATFPERSPYSWQEATSEQFYPGKPDKLLKEW